MTIDQSKITALLERADPSMKLKRLEKELDGEENNPGLREQLIVAVQAMENQKKLVLRREAQREQIDELALERFDTNLAECRMNETIYEGQVEMIVEQIEEIEAQIDELKKAGTPRMAGPNRKGRRSN
jgi:hypothetical protein